MPALLCRLTAPALGAALLALLTACPGPDPSTEACSGKVAGDLVITEYLNDPPGADTGYEYFEVFNATKATISLKGLTIYLAKSDGSQPKTHVVTSGEIPAGGYFVFGDARDALPPYEDYSYADALGGMGNTNGLIGIRCGMAVVDEVSWLTAGTSGAARILNGVLFPDSALNDDPASWCDAPAEFAPGMKGSPGAPNGSCGATGGCLDPISRENRPAVAPKAGELVISEWMPNPSVVADTAGEWFEVVAKAAVDLNGLELSNGTSASIVQSTDCLPLAKDAYAVFVKVADPSLNGGISNAAGTFSFTLGNTNGALALRSAGTLVDQVTWATAGDGVATQVDPTKLDAAQNDDPASACAATATYGTGVDKGTPGTANTACGTIQPADQCTDPLTSQSRAIVPPVAGDLVITEFMAHPAKVGYATGEWFEVFVRTAVDLNGLELGNEGTSKTKLTSTECIRPGAGTYVVFAKSTDSVANGGLPSVLKTFTFGLADSGSRAIVLWLGAVELDRITYTASTLGASTQLHADHIDTAQNDVAANWCVTPAANTYGAGDRGTPGAANLALTCP